MKRSLLFLLFLAAQCARVAAQDLVVYFPGERSDSSSLYVREIDYIVETFFGNDESRQLETMYFLYFGSKHTERTDQQATEGNAVFNMSLVHPVPAAAISLQFQAEERWYALLIDSRRNLMTTSPLLEEKGWSVVPVMAKHVLMGLGADDQTLILISWNGWSGSISIFYDPRFNTDRDFYIEKQKLLSHYLSTHDVREDISLGEMVDSVPKIKVRTPR